MVFEPYGRLLNNVYTKWPVFSLRCNVFAISNNSIIMKQPVRKRQDQLRILLPWQFYDRALPAFP